LYSGKYANVIPFGCEFFHLCISNVFTGVAEHSPASKNQEVSVPQTDIPGLSSRVHNPFEFLGLYGTYHEACHRHDIPAKMVRVNKVPCCDDVRQVQK
jgi:hypothetical protein